MWSRVARSVVLGTLLLANGAASAQDPEAEFKATLDALPRSVFHIVAEGETLATIAEYYLGDAKLAPKLLAANRTRLRDARRLVPGMTLEVPVPSDWQPREPLDQWRARMLKRVAPRPTPAVAPTPGRAPSTAAPRITPEPARIIVVPRPEPTPTPLPAPVASPAGAPQATPAPGATPRPSPGS